MSEVIGAILLSNADRYCILELQRRRTKVLNRGGTGVFCASGAHEGWSSGLEAFRSSGFELSSLGFDLNPRGLHLWCLTMVKHFHGKIMILMRFWSPTWGEPKYSIRAIPERLVPTLLSTSVRPFWSSKCAAAVDHFSLKILRGIALSSQTWGPAAEA